MGDRLLYVEVTLVAPDRRLSFAKPRFEESPSTTISLRWFIVSQTKPVPKDMSSRLWGPGKERHYSRLSSIRIDQRYNDLWLIES